PSPRGRSPRYGRENSPSGRPVPCTVAVANGRCPAQVSRESRPSSSPPGAATRIRACSESRPARAIARQAAFEARPASMSRRKCTRYPDRQLVSCSAPSAPAASTGRSASATTARPSADVLLRPSGDSGKTTPASSPSATAISCLSPVEDAQPLRVVQRRDLQPGGKLTVGGAHAEVAPLEPLAGDAVVVGYLRQPDRPADRVAVGGGPDVPGPLAAGEHRLVAEQVGPRVIDDQADDAAAERPLRARLEQGVTADEAARLVPR